MTHGDAERTPGGPGEHGAPLWSRGGILTLWTVLGALFCGAVDSRTG